MSQEFNPYHKWLGIPLEEQPANHYRLLGVAPFEADADVIEAAADRQMAHVQTYKTGQYSALSQDVLNELASAKVCLLVPDKKAAYDQQLKAALAAKTQRTTPTPPAPQPRLPRATPLITPLEQRAPQTAPARKLSPLLLGGVGVAALGLVVIVAIMAGSRDEPKPPANPPTVAPNVVNQPAKPAIVEVKQPAKPAIVEANQPAKPATDRPATPPTNPPAVAETPRLHRPRKLTMPEGNQVTIATRATGTSSAAGLTYVLAPGFPEGMQINSSTGAVSWQPKEAHGPQDHQVTVRLLDADGKQLDEVTFEIAVLEVNQPPSLDRPSAPTLNPSGVLTFQIQGRDPDLPANQLTYALEDAPEGASVDPQSGAFTWKPTSDQLGKRFALKLRVTDDAPQRSSSVRLISIDVPATLSGPAVAKIEPPMPPAPLGEAVVPGAVAAAKPEGSPGSTQEQRGAVPPAAATAEALAKIKEIFKEQYKGKKPEEKAALAKALMKACADTDDATTRYVLLDEVLNLGTGIGDVTLCWQAIDKLAQEFAMDAIEVKSAALKKLGMLRTADTIQAVATRYVELIEEAAAADNYDAVTALLTTAQPAIQRTKEAALITRFSNRAKELRANKKDYDAMLAAAAVLKEMPDDPAANLAVGSYLCFVNYKLAEGLPLLAKCGNDKLAAAATLELASPTTVEDQRATGDAWWGAAEAARGSERERFQQRAAWWYRLAIPKLVGLEKVKLEKRVEGIPLPPAPVRPTPVVAANTAGNSAGKLSTYRGRIGLTVDFEVVGSQQGGIWGTDVYTDDSSLATAAVHAGVLQPGQKGIVQVTFVAAPASYQGSTRNGVTSQDYGPWAGAFRITAVKAAPAITGAKATPVIEAGGVAANDLIRKFKDQLKLTCSSSYSPSWGVDRLVDGKPDTSWFTKANDSVGTGGSPWFMVEFPSDVVVTKVRVQGNREGSYAQEPYQVLSATITLQDRNGREMRSVTADKQGTYGDLEFNFTPAVRGVRFLRFQSTSDQGALNGSKDIALGELDVE